MKKSLLGAMTLMLIVSVDLHAASTNYCGELTNSYGPLDYRRRAEYQEGFRLIEGRHFTPEIENGIKGYSGSLGADIDYTLRAVPNHHRALAALARIATRDRTVAIVGMRYPVECWFNRAVRFTPDDPAVYITYGSYLFSTGKVEESLDIFKQAEIYDPANATLNYNLGLVYLKQKNYEKARLHAKKAYAGGFPLNGLKNKLVELKQWDKAE